MNIYTLNVGQGQFVVVTGDTQAIIIDTYVPLSPSNDIINVKGALATILEGKKLVGLMITGFDADHFNEVGIKIVLNKYRPNWLMYPKYVKQTGNADACFAAIDTFDRTKAIQRYSIQLAIDKNRVYDTISTDFGFEVFSPHAADMNSSNNSSLVCKITEKSTRVSYLVTGDTENDRWQNILRIFGASIQSTVLAAPHHGSKNGTSQALVTTAGPHTVLISAGVGNQYGHPASESNEIYRTWAKEHWATNGGSGQSLKTEVLTTTIRTVLFK